MIKPSIVNLLACAWHVSKENLISMLSNPSNLDILIFLLQPDTQKNMTSFAVLPIFMSTF